MGVVTSKAVTGNWNTGSNWVGEAVPNLASDTAVIATGADISINTNLGDLSAKVTNNGKLRVAGSTTVAKIPSGLTISTNAGTITDNSGTVVINSGTVTTNNLYIYSLVTGGVVTTNGTNGIVYAAAGTVTANNGKVYLASQDASVVVGGTGTVGIAPYSNPYLLIP